jgi:hypothetical protein
MPSSKNYVRDYKTEMKTATKRGEDAGRVERNKARRQAISKGAASKGDGKHIDHVKPIRSGGKTTPGNTRVRNASSNMSDNGQKKGK